VNRVIQAAVLLALMVVLLAIGANSARAQTGATPEQLAALERVLARPEFQVEEGRSWVDRVLDPLRSVLRAVWLAVVRWVMEQTAGRVGSAFGGLGVWLAGGLVVLGLGIVLRLSRGTLAAEARRAEASSSGPPRAEAELAVAARLAAAGDPRGAVHHRYLAVLRRLDERGLVRFDQALTNRELLPRAATRPTLQAALTPLVERFDQLWYGQSTCSAAEYEAFALLANRVWGAAA
jgi:hypothetical protein